MNIGYCTNIHQGTTLAEILANLQSHAVPVKQAVCPDEPMGIGLWLPAVAVKETLADGQWQRLKEFLDEHQLVPHTFNAFPFDDFHQSVVKQQVYRPDWTSSERLAYTKDVATLMSKLLPPGSQGTISTLPIGWSPMDVPNPETFNTSRNLMLECISALKEIHQQSGQQLCLCVEPEPGCILQTSSQTCDFLNWYLLNDANNAEEIRKYVGVCHDICHAAVMFESQTEALDRYRQADIPIAKVQISSAMQSDFDSSAEDQAQKLEALRKFDEPRYLHQTTIKTAQPPLQYFDDLFLAIRVQQTEEFEGQLRTHFHVPIHLETVETLRTTRDETVTCLNWFLENGYKSQFEVETYAWHVSPESARGGTLAESVINELTWLRQQFGGLNELNQV